MTNPLKKRGGEPKKSPSSGICKTMTVHVILGLLPESESILAEYGLHCFHCSANTLETLEDGCRSHGFADEDIDALVEDLNDLLAKTPPRPETISLTKEAALALAGMMESERRTGEGLLVVADEHGSFCMEFQKESRADERGFSHPEVPAVRIFASALTLHCIGGSTIDFRDGRFTLDLPEDGGACGCRGKCDCKAIDN